MADIIYELVLPTLLWRRVRVVSFEGWERLSEGYAFDLRVQVDRPQGDVSRLLLGEPASFVAHVGPTPRFVHGIASEVRLESVMQSSSGTRAVYRVALVPRLWLLTRRRRSRVFQGLSTRQVVERVLGAAGIPSLWQLEHEPPPREYITQYEETDEELVRRLTAEAGIFFSFLQPPLPELPDGWGGVGTLDAVQDALADVLGLMREVGEAAARSVMPTAAGMAAAHEVMLFGDNRTAYSAIGVVPDGIETLVQQSLEQVSRVVGTAGSEAASVAEGVGRLAAEVVVELLPSQHLRFHHDGGALVDEAHEVVSSMGVRDAVRSDHAVFRTFDPRRPLASLEERHPPALGRGDLTAQSAAAMGAGIATGAASARSGGAATGAQAMTGLAGQLLENAVEGAFEIYDHHDPFLTPNWDYLESEAKRMLLAERRDQRLLEATSGCPLVAVGARFHIDGHPADWANREYAAVEVRHRGHAHAGHGPDAETPVYENELLAVPSDTPFLPARPPRRTVQACLTATVIGDAESAEVMTRGMAEIKVRFHWDREQQGTCWLRCMQAWGGAGFGTQFMPRVGMEVVVGFDGGDPDRPLVLGCVYNGTHPTPFSLPQSQTRSGLRTQTLPDGGGHNELSFEDQQGREQIFVHAERDLDVEVGHDRSGRIDHDDRLHVDHDQTITVVGVQRERVQGGQHLAVQQERRIEVDGPHESVTRGDVSESITGALSQRVRGAADRTLGSSRERVAEDAMLQVGGNRVELVGSHESPKSRTVRIEGRSEISSSGASSIDSEEELVLRVGASSIRITDQRIELNSPEITIAAKDATQKMGEGDIMLLADGTLAGIAEQIVLKSQGASLGLTSEASLDGSRVLLNSPESAEDSVEHEPPEPTVIELCDEDGQPMPYERFRIDLEDGSSVSGVLDAEGRASVFVDQGGEILFPDLPDVDPS